MEIRKKGKGWVLDIDYNMLCRFCGEPIDFFGFWCPRDKRICCEECAFKDNNTIHSRIYETPRKQKHEHFKVELVIKKLTEKESE